MTNTKESFWIGDGKSAWTTKAVVSGTGHAVARNYTADSLRTGDIGITMRMDRERLEHMTDEQRLAAQGLVEDMSRSLLRALGKEEIAGCGFKRGEIVNINDGRFRFEEETRTGVRVVELESAYELGTLRFIPWQKIDKIELAYKDEKEKFDFVIDELWTTMETDPEPIGITTKMRHTAGYDVVWLIDDKGFVKRALRRAMRILTGARIVWGDRLLVEFWRSLENTGFSYDVKIVPEDFRSIDRHALSKSPKYMKDAHEVTYDVKTETDVTTLDDVLPLIRKTVSREHLGEIAEKAAHPKVREAAKLILSES